MLNEALWAYAHSIFLIPAFANLLRPPRRTTDGQEATAGYLPTGRQVRLAFRAESAEATLAKLYLVRHSYRLYF